MRVGDLYRRIRSEMDEETVDKMRTVLRPLYRTAIYDVLQPVQNRVRFRRRLRDVPAYDVGDRDVLFIVVDCLRNDHLSRADYERETTPFLDSVGTYYPNCVTAAPWTYPSVPSILTGRYPHNHGAIYETELRDQGMGNPPAIVRDEVYTLPELLGKAGYDTYFSSAVVTAELPIRGRFERSDVHHDAPADEMVDHLLDWWDSADGDRFGYVQLGDLHAPLRRPDDQPFGEVPDIPHIERWNFTRTTEPREEFETYRRERIRFYDNVLRFVDGQLQRLEEALAQRNELDDTLIVVTGDHGEEFWERVDLEREYFHDPRGVYGTGHGHALIPEVLFVPLIIAGGRGDPTSEWTSTTDIVPTVLADLNVSAEKLSVYDGVPLPLERPAGDRAVLSEEVGYGYDQRAVVRDSHLLISSPHENKTVLFDLEADRSIDDPPLKAELKEYLTGEKHAGETSRIDEETRDRLSDLGYM